MLEFEKNLHAANRNSNNSQQENPSLPWNADNTVKNEEINNNNLNYTSIIINTTINATIAAANNNNVPLCNNTDDDNINIINTTSDNHNETILGNNDRSTISLTSPMDYEGGELEGCGDDNNNNIEDDDVIRQAEIAQCSNCGVRDTPAWRRDLQGISLLCNACGIRRPTELAPDGTIRLMRTQRLEPEFTCNNCGMRNTPCWKGPEGQKLCTVPVT
ncbi:7361_t:CDS:2, partial [Entrophospora sp. SA101]